MLLTKLDLRYSAYCPTPENFEDYDDYIDLLDSYVDILSETIYMENKLALKGIDLRLMDEVF